MNPMSGTDFTAQLAQFSQLEQLTGVNDRLDKLAGQSKDTGGAALLNLLGKLSRVIVNFVGAKIRQLRRFDCQFFLFFTNFFYSFYAIC